MKPHSLRSRIVIASLLWSSGLLVFIHYLFGLAARHHSSILKIDFHALVLFALFFMLAGFLLVRGSLDRFASLRTQLARVRIGEESRVTGEYPSEVQPLVDELNALLEHREEAVRRAVAKAGDLAHGLKTPLAVMAHECDRLSDRDAAAAIFAQIERMQRHIDFHLAHARAAGSGATLGAHTNVAECVEALIRTLQHLHAARGLTIESRVDATQSARVQREDLDEMLGNLLDNACKYARSRIVVTSADGAIVVDDDGPGIAPDLREAVLQRGVRADEAAPGSGLGLAIVRDLAEVYGGSIALGESELGGLRAVLRLPQ